MNVRTPPCNSNPKTRGLHGRNFPSHVLFFSTFFQILNSWFPAFSFLGGWLALNGNGMLSLDLSVGCNHQRFLGRFGRFRSSCTFRHCFFSLSLDEKTHHPLIIKLHHPLLIKLLSNFIAEETDTLLTWARKFPRARPLYLIFVGPIWLAQSAYRWTHMHLQSVQKFI